MYSNLFIHSRALFSDSSSTCIATASLQCFVCVFSLSPFIAENLNHIFSLYGCWAFSLSFRLRHGLIVAAFVLTFFPNRFLIRKCVGIFPVNKCEMNLPRIMVLCKQNYWAIINVVQNVMKWTKTETEVHGFWTAEYHSSDIIGAALFDVNK